MAHLTALVDNDATTPTTNVYEITNRALKAAKLADCLILHGATSAQAAGLPPKYRLATATLAGVRPPSDTTWDEVVQLLACVERERALSPLVERLGDAVQDRELFARL